MKHLNRAVLLASVAAVAGLFVQPAAAQRSLPTFEVDRGWPKIPAQWKLGDASSVAIDAQYVKDRLSPILQNEDLSRYIL